jgi:hypothetical protein
MFLVSMNQTINYRLGQFIDQWQYIKICNLSHPYLTEHHVIRRIGGVEV